MWPVGEGGAGSGALALRGEPPTMPGTSSTAATHRRGRRRGGEPAASPDPVRRGADVLEPEVPGPDVVGAALQLADEGLLAHRSSSPSPGRNVAGVRSRSEAIARAVCDLTVPTEMPSTSAVSASVSCS